MLKRTGFVVLLDQAEEISPDSEPGVGYISAER